MDVLPFRVHDATARERLRAVSSGYGGLTTLDSLLRRVEPGTNRWIYEDEHVAAWLSGQPDSDWVAPGQASTVQTISKLWMYGQPGSGRTLLAATLVDGLVQQLSQQTQDAVCFYFAGSGDERDEVLLCVKALVAQLAQQSDAAYAEFDKSVGKGLMPSLYTSAGSPCPQFDAKNVAHLQSLLTTMARHYGRVSIVINRIDTMPAAVAFQLAAMADAPGSMIRIIFTSGDGGGQRDACVESVSCPVEVTAHADDVRRHVHSEMEWRIKDGAAHLQSDHARTAIESYISENARGS